MALRQFPRKMWLHKKAPDQRSIHETIWQLADNEVTEYVNCRRFVTGSPPAGIDPCGCCDNLGYFYQDVKQALGIIRSLRRATYHFLKQLPEDAWSNTTELPNHGPLSLAEWLEIRESYFPEQIQQMGKAYSEWRAASAFAKMRRSTGEAFSMEFVPR